MHYHSFRWYFGPIRRAEAERRLLTNNPHGAFLIRDSEGRANEFALSSSGFIDYGELKICFQLYFVPQYVMEMLSSITASVHYGILVMGRMEGFT